VIPLCEDVVVEAENFEGQILPDAGAPVPVYQNPRGDEVFLVRV